MSHHIVDGVGNGIVDTFRDNIMQLEKQLILQPVDRQESNEGEHKDEQWRKGHKERECQPFGSTLQFAVDDTSQQIRDHVVERHTLVARQGSVVHNVV